MSSFDFFAVASAPREGILIATGKPFLMTIEADAAASLHGRCLHYADNPGAPAIVRFWSWSQ